MNKTLATFLLFSAFSFSTATSAQSLGSIAKSVASKVSSSSSNNTVTSAVTNLLGTSKVTEADLVGTWKYSEPAVVLESPNVLSKVGGSVATSSIEKEMGTQLSKVGFTKGKASITFKNDKTFSITSGGKTVSGNYDVSGATLTLTRSGIPSVKTNVKKSGSSLQIAVEADKVLSLMNTIGTAAGSSNSSIATATKLLKQYNGMNLGMKFSK